MSSWKLPRATWTSPLEKATWTNPLEKASWTAPARATWR